MWSPCVVVIYFLRLNYIFTYGSLTLQVLTLSQKWGWGGGSSGGGGWGGVEVGGGVGPNNLPVGDVAVRREFLRTSAPLSRPPIHPAACGTQHSRVSTLTSLACHALHEAEPQTCCPCLPSHEATLLVCLECALLGDVT